MNTAADIRPGVWVRFERSEVWRFVQRARHTWLSPDEPGTTGYVQYDASRWPGMRVTFGGFAAHDEPCRIVTVTPQAVAHV